MEMKQHESVNKTSKLCLILVVGVLLIFGYLNGYKSSRERDDIIDYFKSNIDSVSQVSISFNIKSNRKKTAINDRIFLAEIKKTIINATRESRSSRIYDVNGHITLFSGEKVLGYISFYFDFDNDEVWLLIAKERQKHHVTVKYLDKDRYWYNLVKKIYNLDP